MGQNSKKRKRRFKKVLQKSVKNNWFPKLFELGYIGKLRLKNRIVRAAYHTQSANTDGTVSTRDINHCKELAKGGAGLITTGYAYVDDKASKSSSCQLGASSTEHQPGLGWLADTIKENGAAACLQIGHAGKAKFLGKPPVKAASRVPWEELLEPNWLHAIMAGSMVPEELTIEEIKEIVEAFGDAALRGKLVGFDMVEVHAAHAYLVADFLSPNTNKRGDWYGGRLEHRMRFLLEVVENIRGKVGPDYPLSIRLSGTDYIEGGITIDQTKEVAKALEKASVDVIHVSGGAHHTMDKCTVSMYWPPAYNVWAAKEIKDVVSIPVIASGGINSPELAEKILEEGKSDFIALGRPLEADPYFPLKAKEGRPEDIRPCIRCGDCQDRGSHLSSVHCAVNAADLREEELKITPATKLKKVAVVGGGPAGMEAARIAALRGHQVTLFEKRKLGGMLIEASTPEFKADIRMLINYLSTQVKKTGVKVINSEATSKTIIDGKFDVAIVATGGIPRVPDVLGLDKPCVVTALDVLGGAELGKNIIVVGGGQIGCDVALFLAEQGKRVTITTRGDNIGKTMGFITTLAFRERLSKQDFEIRTGVHLDEVTDSGIIVYDRFDVKSEIKGDNVILASGLMSNRKLFDELSQVPDLEVFAVGDCVEPRTIFDAIHEGYSTALLLI